MHFYRLFILFLINYNVYGMTIEDTEENNLITNTIDQESNSVLSDTGTGKRYLNTASDNKDDEGNQVIVQPRVIFPGTKWCGAGSTAENETDIGVFEGLDMCCRDHDNCFDNILAGETKHGLTNYGSFTKSHCDCDEKFHKCLEEDESYQADQVGSLYFNYLQPQCFREERKIVRCAKSSGFALTSRCQEYKLSKNDKKIWQWFDAKEY